MGRNQSHLHAKIDNWIRRTTNCATQNYKYRLTQSNSIKHNIFPTFYGNLTRLLTKKREKFIRHIYFIAKFNQKKVFSFNLQVTRRRIAIILSGIFFLLLCHTWLLKPSVIFFRTKCWRSSIDWCLHYLTLGFQCVNIVTTRGSLDSKRFVEVFLARRSMIRKYSCFWLWAFNKVSLRDIFDLTRTAESFGKLSFLS